MNKESSLYTILYAAIMVVIVAVGLAFTHQALNEKQIANVNMDKMQQVLRALRVDVSAKDAAAKYNELIKEAYLIDEAGQLIAGTEGVGTEDAAFQTDIASKDSKGLPVFVAETNGQKYYVIPMTGSGLWGAVWGYISFEEDGSTVFAADFSHESETPGLGAEIENRSFRAKFEDKGLQLIKDGEYKSIAVVKPGQTHRDKDYVDGISGGTITSNGVSDMLYDSVGKYKEFLLKLNADK